MGLTERLSAWSCMLAVAGLRRGDLLNSAPATTVLMKEGLIGFAAKNQNQGQVWRKALWWEVVLLFLTKWLSEGYQLFLADSGDFCRYFWIGQPIISESEICFPNQDHAFWSCANKMVNILLLLSAYKEDHGIRPHSLKVTTISTLMDEIDKGNENLSHLATQGNYRAAAVQDMGEVYSRNLAQHQISVSELARKAW